MDVTIAVCRLVGVLLVALAVLVDVTLCVMDRRVVVDGSACHFYFLGRSVRVCSRKIPVRTQDEQQ